MKKRPTRANLYSSTEDKCLICNGTVELNSREESAFAVLSNVCTICQSSAEGVGRARFLAILAIARAALRAEQLTDAEDSTADKQEATDMR